MSRTAPPEILVDGVDLETFIRQQFEYAGLEAPSDSVVTEIASEVSWEPLSRLRAATRSGLTPWKNVWTRIGGEGQRT